MSKIERCRVCNNTFEVCLSCDKNIDENYQWRRVVCCPEHFDYHIPIIEYVRKQIDKETAKARLNKAIDKYGMIEFNDNVKNIVNEILSEEVIEQEVIQTPQVKKTTRKAKK